MRGIMEQRISIVSIIVSDRTQADRINAILHEYAEYIKGRMGLAYDKKQVSIICVVLDAPNSVTSALSGKLGQLTGVTAKTNTAKI
jgi:putative iron-only hydrogenase system regulator